LTFDAAGNLYGSAYQGESGSNVFKLTSGDNGQWTYHVIYPAPYPSQITDSLIFDPAGNLYGMSVTGGYENNGTIAELETRSDGHWVPELIHRFRGGADGGYPFGGLTFDAATGNMYGTATGNGAGRSADSTVLELTPSSDERWSYHLIYRFCCYDQPYAGVALDSLGDLFGTTAEGGLYQRGDVYELTLSGGTWMETDLYSFCSAPNCSDGAGPYAGMVWDSAGNLYGTTVSGGAYGLGVVFEITP
jgi:uncharacterized repeat protein (TIGR03803 family)